MPRPTPTFHNETIIHEPDIEMKTNNCENQKAENGDFDEIGEKVEMQQFKFDDFQSIEVEMEEIIPPPRVIAGNTVFRLIGNNVEKSTNRKQYFSV